MPSENIDGGKIFVWGQIGESLKELDSERLMMIAEQNANYSFGVKANDIIMQAVERLKNGAKFASVKHDIDELNRIDELFREIRKFLHEKPVDMLSLGSFITGETESKSALLDLGDGK